MTSKISKAHLSVPLHWGPSINMSFGGTRIALLQRPKSTGRDSKWQLEMGEWANKGKANRLILPST
jgi:hypothetical protein